MPDPSRPASARRVVEAMLPARLGVGFRFLVASSWISNLGDGFALAAGPLLVASETRRPSLVALATLLQELPWLAFGLLAGALADRLSRVVMVATVDLLRAGVLGLLAVSIVTKQVDIALVLVAMFLLGTAEVFSNTASSTLLPSLVGREDLALANSRLQTGFVTVYQLAGPPLGAVLFAASRPLPFVGQATLVAVGAFLVVRVKLPAAPDADQRSGSAAVNPGPSTGQVRHEVAEGFRFVVRHPAVRTLVLTIFIFNITFGAAWSVLVLYSKERLHLGSVGFGLLTTAAAVGGIAGTLGYGWITRRLSLGNLMRIGLVIETLTHLSLALTTVPAVALAIMVVFGAHAFVWSTTSVTVRQRAVPQALQGRVSSVNNLGVYGGLVIGAALGGQIADHFGITAPFWFAFAGSGCFVVLIWRQLAHIAHDDDLPIRSPTASS
ncbi:MAG TPA: MFS transporter [Acidimicrobiales bacterium]|nr:MFS transporter [Acidimicrobiales bacterium]